MAFGHVNFNSQDYVPALENRRGMSCSETCCLLSGAWFHCRYGSFWMSSFQLMFPEVRSFLVFQYLNLSLLPLAFSLILTVA